MAGEDYRLIDHTADLGFEVDALTKEQLFAGAALALARVIAPAEGLATDEELVLDREGEDDVLLLRALLDEQLFRFETEAFLPVEATVTLEPGRGRVVLRGQRVDPKTHPIERVVKAVTLHGMEVEKTEKGWRARVILDL